MSLKFNKNGGKHMKRAIWLGLMSVAILSAGAWADWASDANTRIEQIRKRDAKITVLDRDGNPVSGVTVTVAQKKHDFGFGSAICYQADQTYYAKFKDYFEWAVVQNELKWGHDEPSQGTYNYEAADFLVNYCQANGLKVRGHNIFWSGSLPSWIYSPMSNSELQAAMTSRASNVMTRYQGRLAHWDVYNEMLSDTFFTDKLGESVRYWTFTQARPYDSSVKLFVNEVGVENSDSRTADLINLVQYLLDNGADVDGIGLEAHMTTIDPVAFKAKLDLIAQFEIPIWITEFTSDASTDALKADTLEQVYRVAFSHPMVEGALMWGFWEGAPGVPGWYLVKNDWTLNEVGERYFGMMDEWTTNQSLVSDSAGQVSFRGFRGTYNVTLSKDGQPLGTKTLELGTGTTTAEYTYTTSLICDDFEAGTLNTTNWDTTLNGGTVAIANGKLTVTSVSSSNMGAIFSKTKVCPQSGGTVTLSSDGVNFGYYVKGNAWGFSGIYDGANYILLYTNDETSAFEIRMCIPGMPMQYRNISDVATLNGDVPFVMTWAPDRVVITQSGTTIFDSATMNDSNNDPWDIPSVPMAVYARSGWNTNSISFTNMEVQTTGDVDVYSSVAVDGFEDGVLDSSLWKTVGNLGQISESNNTLTINSLGSSNPAMIASTFAVAPADGTIVVNSTGLSIGYWSKGNQWGLSTPSFSDYILLVMDWSSGNLNLYTRKAGGTTQVREIWSTGSLSSAMVYSIYWTKDRVVVWAAGNKFFDSAVTTTDSSGNTWNIPTVPMEVMSTTGYNNNAITMNDLRVDTQGAVKVLKNVFTDDFNTASPDTSIWDTSANLGTITQSGGYLTVQSASSASQGDLRSKASVETTDGNEVVLSSKGINFGFWLKGNLWGLRSDDESNKIYLNTDDNTGNLTLTMRSNGGANQTLTLIGNGNLVAYVAYEIRWSSSKVVVTRGGAVIFDSTVTTTDSNGSTWAIPTGEMKAYVKSGYNTNSISFTDMSLQAISVVEEETTPGDFNNDGKINATDIDLLSAAINNHSTNYATYDLTKDGSVNSADMDYLIKTILKTYYGDADLNGSVGVSDLSVLAAYYNTASGASWANGDFDGNGAVGVSDLSILAANYNSGSASTVSWAEAYAQAFGTTGDAETSSDEATADDSEDSTSSVCSSLGLSLIAGLALMGLMIVKLEE
jgi:GH35 family endo-1,4-beta-xylanase